MARFNHTDRTLETLTSFLVNQTGTAFGEHVFSAQHNVTLIKLLQLSPPWVVGNNTLHGVIRFTVHLILTLSHEHPYIQYKATTPSHVFSPFDHTVPSHEHIPNLTIFMILTKLYVAN